MVAAWRRLGGARRAGGWPGRRVARHNTGRPGWHDVDLRPALEPAASDGTQAAVLDAGQQDGALTLVGGDGPGRVVRRPLVLGG